MFKGLDPELFLLAVVIIKGDATTAITYCFFQVCKICTTANKPSGSNNFRSRPVNVGNFFFASSSSCVDMTLSVLQCISSKLSFQRFRSFLNYCFPIDKSLHSTLLLVPQVLMIFILHPRHISVIRALSHSVLQSIFLRVFRFVNSAFHCSSQFPKRCYLVQLRSLFLKFPYLFL